MALAASVLLLSEELREAPAVCGQASTCAFVGQSPLLDRLPLPLPWVGTVVFLALFALSFVGSPRARLLVRVGATLGGVLGILLLLYQVVSLGVVCPWCAAVDGAVVLAALAAAFADGAAPRLRPRWLLAGGLALGLPLALALPQPAHACPQFPTRVVRLGPERTERPYWCDLPRGRAELDWSTADPRNAAPKLD